MAQCFKNKLINKSETLLEEKRKYIHHDLKKKTKNHSFKIREQHEHHFTNLQEARNTDIQIKSNRQPGMRQRLSLVSL